jgi:HEAT repeat protein
MTPEEQLQVVETLAETLKDNSSEVRKEAFRCLVGFGVDGLGRIIDVIDDNVTSLECKREALLALGSAFAEGRVDKTKQVRMAIKALEDCLGKENDVLAEAAIDALGEIGTQAITSKEKLLALMNSKKDNNRICVKVASSLLKISPIH